MSDEQLARRATFAHGRGAGGALYGEAPTEARNLNPGGGWGKMPSCPSPTLGPKYRAAQSSERSFCYSNA